MLGKAAILAVLHVCRGPIVGTCQLSNEIGEIGIEWQSIDGFPLDLECSNLFYVVPCTIWLNRYYFVSQAQCDLLRIRDSISVQDHSPELSNAVLRCSNAPTRA